MSYQNIRPWRPARSHSEGSSRRRIAAALLACTTALAAADVSRADYIAYDETATPTNQSANTLFLREDFVVPSGPGIYVTNLATYIGSGAQGSYTNTTQIWSTTGAVYSSGIPKLSGSAAITSGSFYIGDSERYSTATNSTSSNFFVLDNYTPVYLAPGSYAVIGAYPTSGGAFYNAGTGTAPSEYSGGLITFPSDNASSNGYNMSNYSGSSSISSSTSWSTPGTNSYFNQYVSGDFTFVAAPEPATISLLAASGVLILRRRRPPA